MAHQVETFISVVLMSLLVKYIHCDLSLVKDNFHVSCFPDNDNFVVYLSPPDVQPKDVKEVLNDVIWENDDWTQVSINESITDLRWTEFNNNRSNHLKFSSDEPVSFSVYAPYNFSLFILISNDMPIRTLKSKSVEERTNGWYHFTLIRKNHSLVLYENEKVVRIHNIWQNIPPGTKNITIKNFNDTIWKIQDLKSRWSNTTTQGDPTVLKIHPSDKECLTVYYYLCENCYLEVNSVTVGKTYMLIWKNQSKLWSSSEIKLQSGVENVITFYRKTNNSDLNGIWGLDLRYCRNFEDSIVKTNVSHNEEYSCKLLNEENASNNSALCEEPGKLGMNCQKNCSEVLGSNFTYCEHYWICRNDNCSCAWGFYGDQCEKNCTEGLYGLNCTKKCRDCSNCDKITGECPASDVATTSGHKSVLILILAIIVVIITAFVIYIFRNKIRSYFSFLRRPNNSQEAEGEPLQATHNHEARVSSDL